MKMVERNMGIELPRIGEFTGFAIIVDINSFTSMVQRAEGKDIDQFTRDVLSEGIDAVERNKGNKETSINN